ncbi:MAG: hypothetical protein ACD_34C00403G0001 [uncultured bacterium]|nr:MAG: hypothetical protein ACD_34C00403G0001 [uncultured bacterium]
MIHANVNIASRQKCGHGLRQHGNFGSAAWNLNRRDPSLGLETLWQMRIGIQGNAIRPEFNDLTDRALK